MNLDNITFDLEASDQEAAFFALYAGLRMYKWVRGLRTPPGAVAIAAAEAYCMLEQLKEAHPEAYRQAEEEYEEVYAGKLPDVFPVQIRRDLEWMNDERFSEAQVAHDQRKAIADMATHMHELGSFTISPLIDARTPVSGYKVKRCHITLDILPPPSFKHFTPPGTNMLAPKTPPTTNDEQPNDAGNSHAHAE
jgi:hypothetical protein